MPYDLMPATGLLTVPLSPLLRLRVSVSVAEASPLSMDVGAAAASSLLRSARYDASMLIDAAPSDRLVASWLAVLRTPVMACLTRLAEPL
jgi:hypothetical protein